MKKKEMILIFENERDEQTSRLLDATRLNHLPRVASHVRLAQLDEGQVEEGTKRCEMKSHRGAPRRTRMMNMMKR